MTAQAKRRGSPTQKASKGVCNTKTQTKTIVIPFRVTVQQWKQLLRKAGGKGALSGYIRKKLGFSK